MAAYRLDRLSILVIDESPQVRRLIKSVLGVFGCRAIAEAVSGTEAIARMRESTPDIVILDQTLGDRGGIAFARHLRCAAESPNPLVPILLLVSSPTREIVNAARDGGVNELLTKPISPEPLYRRLQALIESPRPFVRTRDYFGPDRRRSRSDTYQGPERRADAVPAKKTATGG